MHVDALNATEYLRAMNAVMRPKYEVYVLTNEAIEVHLASLHAGQDELREDVRELRADNKSLRDKVDAVQTALSQDIKTLDKKVDAVNANLGDRITQLSDDVASMRGLQKATIWLIGILGSLGTVGKFLHWF